MKNRRHLLFFIPIGLLFFASCSNIKYLQEGENLYVKGKVTLQPDTSFPEKYIEPLEERLEGDLRPQPNSTILGLRPKLYIYNLARNAKSEKGLKGWLKYKVGEAPVLLTDVNREYNEKLLTNRLENFGFFQAEVASDVSIKNRKATVTYLAKPNHNYKINKVVFSLDSSALGKAVKKTQQASLLQTGSPYNLDVIIRERERIDNELKEQGYYYSSPDNFIIQADSTIGNHQVDLFVKIKKETPKQARQPYYINNIYIYPNYTIIQGDYKLSQPDSSNFYKGFYVVDPDHTFRKFALARSMFFKKGALYNRTRHNLAISQLVGLGTFKFVKNNFVLVDSSENLLDVYYYLTPLPKKALRLELLGKTASVYNGSEANLSWSHRNAFKSAELFRVSVFGGYELQTGGDVNLHSSFYRYGAEASLTFPRLIVPFQWTSTRQFVPHTNITTGYEFMNRQGAYRLNSMKFSFGYSWKESKYKEHELDLLEIGYVQPGKISPEYEEELAKNPNLRHAIEKQFTFGPNYFFTFTNTMDAQKRNTMYFRGGLDLSGNIYGLIKGADYDKGNVYQLLNADFAQYIKVETDFRNYTKIGNNAEVATRAMFGYGYAYGNSKTLPYVKQFFTGGPNSLRAFRARAIGPGSYEPEEIGTNNFIPDMTGDIKIELNAEYRKKLFSIVHGALFVDAGNIWLLHEDVNKPGAKFSKDFLSEMAVGAGLGLRFDLSFLVLRTDLAIPLRIPYLPKGNRWVMDEIDFGDKQWRKENLIFNLAIGYPF